MSRLIRCKWAGALLLGAMPVALHPFLASGSVFTNGDVLPADDPTTLANEGLPVDGNFIDPFALDPFEFFEGTEDIIVGQKAFGVLLISGESALRYQNLIIGDIGVIPNTMQLRRGTGVVRITGFGSLFNNDPNIYPPGITDYTPERVSPPGFDLYVGGAGTGTLEISLGGRAEIQDAVIVGDLPGSTGTILVDGFDSFLGSGGSVEEGGPEEPNHMIIGRRGIGFMTVQNGGQVVTEAPTGGDQDRFIVGAAIGSDPFDTEIPEPGGNGTVTVTGPGSKWIIGGTLQVGGFHDADDGFGLGKDFEGDNVLYDAESGRGTLIVAEGALVNVITPAEADPDVPSDLFLAIGRFGRVELSGGYMSVGVADVDGSRAAETQIINDGLIKGGGRIDTGVFRNRYLGRVNVGPAQTLIVDSTSEFDPDLSDVDDEPLVNFGLIEVLGTPDARAEIEFIRAPEPADAPGSVPFVRPFLNRRLGTTESGAFEGGTINAQNATLRFQSGIFNEGAMIFSQGMNIISGRVDNIAGLDVNGLFHVFPSTTVVIEDDFSSGGITDPMAMISDPIVNINAGGTLSVIDLKSLTLKGSLQMEVSLINPSKIIVSGDVGLRADLFVSFASDALTNLSHGDAFELIQFGGDIGNVDDTTDPLRLRPDLTLNPVLNVVPSAAFQSLYPNLDLITVQILQSMYLMALDPSMVGPPGGPGAMGPDFNGDGVVDLNDLAIWQANVGITMGASVLQGDADGDGDVDGDDFLIWQASIGPFPGAGAGVGNELAASVPEPASVMLLFCGGLMAMAMRQRRSRCWL